MKKFLFIISLALFFVACTGTQKDKKSKDEGGSSYSTAGFVTYQFKVDGLQDSIVSDSIWRIIFQVEGIDKLVLSRDDSMAVFTVDPKLVDDDLLKKEIIGRGGKLLD